MAVNLPYGNLSDQILSFSQKPEPELPFQPAIDGIDTSANPLRLIGTINFLEDDQLSTSTTPDMRRHSWEGFEDLPFSKAPYAKPPVRHAPPPPHKPVPEIEVAQTPTSTGSNWHALTSHHISPSDTASLPDYKSLHTSVEHVHGDLPFRRSQSVRLRQRHMQPQPQTSYDDTELLKRGHNATLVTDPSSAPTQWNVHVKLRNRPNRIISNWFPVFLSVENGVISIRESIHALPVSGRLDDPDIFKDIILQHLHSLSQPINKRFENGAKITQLKLQQVSYLEKRTFRRFFMYEHVTRRLTVCKFGFRDLNQLKEFQEAFNNALRHLPVTRQQGVAYHANEVFVDVKDHAHILMSCDGAVLERESQNRILVQAYLTGAPECRLLLNDVESILKQTGNTSLLTTGISKPVHMERPEIHPCVDTNQFRESRDVVFFPVDGARFELLRCTVEPHLLPPVHVSALMEFRDNTIYISSAIYVRRRMNLRTKPIKNLVLRFPIPPSWRNAFSAETKFGKKSVRSTSRGSFRRNVKSSSCRITTSGGQSSYIPELGCVVWEIGTYQHSTFQYNFMCEVDFRAGMQNPAGLEVCAEVEYTVPGSSSGLSVRALKIDRKAEKWVRYEILYHYKVQMYPELAYD